MIDDFEPGSLVTHLLECAHFEDAATGVLRVALAVADRALASSRYARTGRLLRGVVHLRPADAYLHLFGIAHPSGQAISEPGYLTSATAWRYIVEHRCPVSLDVHLGTVRPWLAGAVRLRDSPRSPGFAGETRERMLERETTHVHVVPLRAPGGAVSGIISLEASCRAATGEDLVWGACNEELQLLADIATPYLGSLPLRPASAPPTDALLPVIGASTASLVQLLRVFAQQEETILFAGPTGVGKSRLARYCHEQSARKGERFEALDLLAVPEELQMAELFGWKRGAFTGAVKDNIGAIGRAARGTLFIDEIDKLSLKAQGGLLQVLETRAYRAIGEDAGERRANVRFMIGTNTELLASVRAGRFREDLYYRIHVLPVRVPPLSERLDELPAWARYMLERRHREVEGEGEVRIVSEALELLGATPWPGNLRQLDNIMRRAYVLALVSRSPGSPLVIKRGHVEHSLSYEDEPATESPSSLLDLLWTSAKAFAAEPERRGQGHESLPLELADAFRGLVIAAAVHQSGNREDALRGLKLEHLVKNRNHHRMLRKEIARVRELVAALGGQIRSELREALDQADA